MTDSKFNSQITMSDLAKQLKTNTRYAKLLEQYGIKSVKDLLMYFPREHEDRANIMNLGQVVPDGQTTVSVKGHILKKSIRMVNGKKLYDIKFEDENGKTGYINIFNAGFIASKIQEDKRYIIVGKLSYNYSKLIFRHPDVIETQGPAQEMQMHNIGRLFPIYSEMQGIKPSWFAKKIWEQMANAEQIFEEAYSEDFRKKYKLPLISNAIKWMHYPESYKHKKHAQYRIFFDRLLKIQLYSQLQRLEYQESGKHNPRQMDWNIVKEFTANLPWKLTNAQKKCVKQIIEDIHLDKPMMRLLQGDVGSGKTVVATIGAYYVYKKWGGQSVFMAPLDVLAQQHYKTIAKVLLPMGVKVGILNGSMTKSQKDKVKEQIKNRQIDIIVGTHAVIQDDVFFKDLKLVVIDEQHKFGVRQRAFFKRFDSPNILQMSATPIPRSMALAFFGEFDVSVIDQMPMGRKEIITKTITMNQWKKNKERILSRIAEGEKVFVIAPLIDESEKMEDVSSAIQTFEEMQDMFPSIRHRIGLIHGKLKNKEKDEIMHKFKEGKTMMLVSTTVIEVGVDIPEATIMLIKSAERFGLSQLHQLRGRIGRSDRQSYCFLWSNKKSGDTYKRLKAMEDTSDGFKLAEIDLQTRGAGEILGTRQSGISDIPMEILSNVKFIEIVQSASLEIIEKYPELIDKVCENKDEIVA